MPMPFSALSKFEVHAIGDQMNAESVISVISVAFFVYLYHGIERFEQRFTRNVVEMLQAQQPKERVWICIIGNFASIEYYGQTFIRIYKFFGRRLVVYDFITTDCTEFVHDAGDVQTLLEETAQEHEGKQNLAALVHDSMVEILGGDWHCAVFDENVKFSISFSDASKIRKFETKSKQNQIIKLWTVIK